MEQLVKMDIPDKLVSDYISGKLDISNAVARNNTTGRIDSYVKLTSIDSKKTHNLSSKEAIAIAAGGTVLLVGGLIVHIIKKKKKSMKKIEVPEYIAKFHSIFQIYLREAKEGQLDIATICELIEVIDEIEANNDGTFTIDFSASEVKELLEIILDYTKQLQICNNYSVNYELSNNSDHNINIFKKCLLMQKDYLENAA